jgi:hypothetical protein
MFAGPATRVSIKDAKIIENPLTSRGSVDGIEMSPNIKVDLDDFMESRLDIGEQQEEKGGEEAEAKENKNRMKVTPSTLKTATHGMVIAARMQKRQKAQRDQENKMKQYKRLVFGLLVVIFIVWTAMSELSASSRSDEPDPITNQTLSDLPFALISKHCDYVPESLQGSFVGPISMIVSALLVVVAAEAIDIVQVLTSPAEAIKRKAGEMEASLRRRLEVLDCTDRLVTRLQSVVSLLQCLENRVQRKAAAAQANLVTTFPKALQEPVAGLLDELSALLKEAADENIECVLDKLSHTMLSISVTVAGVETAIKEEETNAEENAEEELEEESGSAAEEEEQVEDEDAAGGLSITSTLVEKLQATVAKVQQEVANKVRDAVNASITEGVDTCKTYLGELQNAAAKTENEDLQSTVDAAVASLTELLSEMKGSLTAQSSEQTEGEVDSSDQVEGEDDHDHDGEDGSEDGSVHAKIFELVAQNAKLSLTSQATIAELKVQNTKLKEEIKGVGTKARKQVERFATAGFIVTHLALTVFVLVTDIVPTMMLNVRGGSVACISARFVVIPLYKPLGISMWTVLLSVLGYVHWEQARTVTPKQQIQGNVMRAGPRPADRNWLLDVVIGVTVLWLSAWFVFALPILPALVGFLPVTVLLLLIFPSAFASLPT